MIDLVKGKKILKSYPTGYDAAEDAGILKNYGYNDSQIAGIRKALNVNAFALAIKGNKISIGNNMKYKGA